MQRHPSAAAFSKTVANQMGTVRGRSRVVLVHRGDLNDIRAGTRPRATYGSHLGMVTFGRASKLLIQECFCMLPDDRSAVPPKSWRFCPRSSALRFGTRSKRGTCTGVIQARFGMPLALCHRFRSASGRRSIFRSLAEYSHSAQAHPVRRRSSRSCSNPINLRQSGKICQPQPFRAAPRWRWRGVTLPHGSSQNLCRMPLGKRRLVAMAHSRRLSYNLGRRTRCTCSLATSTGNGGKRPALPGNCCPRRKVRIKIRAPTPARC